MGYLQDLLKFEFESDATTSYIILHGGEGDKLQKLQIEMIEQNPNPLLLPLSLRVQNNENMIYYNITSKITLKQLLQKRSLKKQEFLDILHLISKILIECKNYYAFDKNFALDEELIYVNPATLEVSMMYIPLNFDIDFKPVFKDFIKRLLDDLVRIEEVNDLGFMQNIRMYLREEAFNLQDFQKLINSFKGNVHESMPGNKASTRNFSIEPKEQYQKPQEKIRAVPTIQKNDQIPPQSSIPQKSKIPPVQGSQNSIPPRNQQPKSVLVPPSVNNQVQQGSSDMKMKYPTNLIAIGAVLQVGVLALIIVASVLVMSGKNPDIGMIGGVVIILGAVDFLVMRKLFEPGKKVAISDTNKTTTTGNREKIVTPGDSGNVIIPEVQKKGTQPKINNPNMNKREIENIRPQNEPVYTNNVKVENEYRQGTFIHPNNLGDTVIMDNQPSNMPYLINIKDGLSKKIYISKPNFIIGRLREQVDFELTGPNISKVHAEIFQKDGIYYIKDLNSSNGTYVNSQKIKSNFEYELKNKDVIRFANMEFEFILG